MPGSDPTDRRAHHSDAAGAARSGPLGGVRIVEFAGIGPGPLSAMLLADLGATVLRIDRREPSGLGIERPLEFNYSMRNRHAISIDLKSPDGLEAALVLIESSDALIEGFRPGVMERIGLGPDVCLARNPRLVYGRVTGWGQTGPLAHTAGHDINYIALTGVLDAIGRQGEPPTVPLNLIGDYAGGSLYLAIGVLAGLMEARHSGRGQVVDAAIVDGVAHLATMLFGLVDAGQWARHRGTNILDGGRFFYDVYECSDHEYVSIGPIEPKFLAELIGRVDLAIDPDWQTDPDKWAAARATFARTFATRRRDEWCDLLRGTDACFAPVLSFDEARHDEHLTARGTFVDVAGRRQPAPAPRFSRTASPQPTPAAPVDSDVSAALAGWLQPAEIDAWMASGVLRSSGEPA